MKRRHAIVFTYTPWTRYSVNALVAAIDKLDLIDVYVIDKLENIIPLVSLLGKKYMKLILAFSLNTIMLTYNDVLDKIIEINTVLKRNNNIIKIAGGPHATGDPLGTIKKLGFDIVVIGEGEETLSNIVETIVNNGDLFRIKGLYTLSDNKPLFTGRRKPIDLNKYLSFPIWRRMAGPIEITRGCPYGCFYCQVSYMHGFNARHRDIDNIVYHAGAMAKLGFHDIRFITPNGLGYGLTSLSDKPNIDLLEELLERLKRKVGERHGSRIFYGTFPSEFRPEHMSYEIARMLRKYVANKNIIVGAQSGSDRILKIINRGHSVSDVFNAVEALQKAGFRADVDFIIGLPGETEEDQLSSLDVMKKLVSMGARIHLHVFMPLPGTPFAFAEPGRIPKWLKKEVYRLIGKGAAYGQWIRQEEIAQKIYMLRRKGIILTGAVNYHL